MAANLPVVGAEVAIIGMNAFKANANQIAALLQNMGRAARLFSRQYASGAGDTSKAEAQRTAAVERASKAFERAKQQEAAANQRAHQQVVAAENARTTIEKRAAQERTNARTRATQAKAKLAQIDRAGDIAVEAQQNRVTRATERLAAAQNLAAKAPTAARTANVEKARISLAATTDRLAAIEQRAYNNTNKAAADAAAANARRLAATRSGAAQVAQAQGRVAAATANAATVAQTGAARVTASSQAMAAAATLGATTVATGFAVAAAGIIASVVAIGMAFNEVVRQSAAYQDQLTFLGVVSNTTGKALFDLSQQQLNLSRYTTTAVNDIAILSAELLKAEVPLQAVRDEALNAANALVVASNGELDAARAATTMKIAHDSFSASGATYISSANAINAAAQNSTLTLSNMADAIKQGGATAARYGLNIEEFATAVGLLGQVIPSGTEAGTGLRNMFVQLQKPSKEGKELMNQYGISLHDAAGNTLPFVDILHDLEAAFGPVAVATGKITEAQRDYALATIAGERQQKILSTLIEQGVEGWTALAQEITNTQSVLDSHGQITATTASKMEMLGNNVTALGLAFGQGLDPYLNQIVDGMLRFAQSIDPTMERADQLGQIVGGFLANVFLNLGEIIGSVIVPAFLFFFDMLGNWINLFVGVGTAVIQVAGAIGETYVRLRDILFQTFANIVAAWFGLGDNFAQGANVLGNIWDSVVQMASATGAAVARGIQGMATAWSAVVNSIASGVSVFGQNLNNVVQGAVQAANGVISAFNGLSSAIARILGGVASAINGFLDAASAIPEVGERIGGARVAVGQFAGATAAAVGAAGVSISGVTHSAGNALAGLGESAGRVGVQVQSGLGAAGAAFSGLGTSVNASMGGLGNTFGNFTNDSLAAVRKLATGLKMPEIQNYADKIAANIEKARNTVNQAANRPAGRIGTEPDPNVPRGAFPGGDGGDGGAGDAAKKAAKDLAEAMNDAAELLRDFFDDIENAARDTANQIGEAFEKAELDVAKAIAQAAKEVDEAVVDANNSLRELDSERAIQRDADARRDALENELEFEQRLREEALDDAEVLYQRELEDVEAIEDKKRQAREQAFDRNQEREARERDERREAEDRDYDRSFDKLARELDKQQSLREDALSKQQSAQQDALEAVVSANEDALERQHKALEDALERDHDARETALEARLDQEERALEASQKIREDALKAQFEAEDVAREHGEAIGEIEREAGAGRAQAQAEYAKELSIGVKGSIAKARLDEKLAAIKSEEDTARERLRIKEETDTKERLVEQDQQRRLADLQKQFELENAAREAAADAARLALKEQIEREILALRTITEAETTRLQVESDTMRRALRDQHEREMDDLHARHERERDDLSDRIENDRLQRQKQRAREDREFAEKQEQAKQRYIEEENKRQLEATRKQEDLDRNRKRAQDYAAIYQKQLDEAKRARLAEELDEEEYQRRVQQIQDERDKKIAATGVTLDEQQRMIAEALDREVRDLNEQLDEKIKTIKERYVDRMEDLIRDGGEAMRPIIDNIGEQMESAFQGAHERVDELITVLKASLAQAAAVTAAINAIPKMPSAPTTAGGGGTTGGGGGGGKCDWYGIYNACRGNGGSDSACRSKADSECPPERRAGGGPVRAGRTYVVGEHGPEIFTAPYNGTIIPNGMHMPGDCPSCPNSPASVRALESLSRGMGSSNSSTINNSYTVNAAYGRTQPEGSLKMDLTALIALTSR